MAWFSNSSNLIKGQILSKCQVKLINLQAVIRVPIKGAYVYLRLFLVEWHKWLWGGTSRLLGNQIQWSQWLWVCPQMGHILYWSSKTNWTMTNMLFYGCWSVCPAAYRLWLPQCVECGQTISQLSWWVLMF